jgi:hypothetical protein
MLKKTIIGLVVLSVLAFVSKPILAAEEDLGDVYKLKAYSWPVEFKAVDLGFTIPVYMDVGLFFEINNKKDVVGTGITLKQVTINTYEGCSIAMNIQTNFDMELGCRVVAADPLGIALGGEYACEIRDAECVDPQPKVCKTLSDWVEKRTVWVQLKDPKVFELDYGKGKHIADVILTVKPDFEVTWYDP